MQMYYYFVFSYILDDPETSSEAKAKYEEIAEKAIGMTESIKHGIVLLQIAKNATLPEVQFKAKQNADQEQSVSPKQRLKDSTIFILQNDFGKW